MKLAFLYAGQGTQHPGMGRDLYETYPAFRQVLDSAQLDFDLKELCFEGPEEKLSQTQYTQPCMVAFAAGVTAVLREKGIIPEVAAGLSLGEYSALQAAGVFDSKTAVELVAFRGTAMAQAVQDRPCGMAAVLMLGREQLAALRPGALVIDLASKPGGVDLAAAGDLGLTVIWALSLPGKVAPVTAGAAMKTTICNMLRELGL